MDRTREARRATMATVSATHGLSRRRHRSSSLRDSPEDDGPVEFQETTRLRDRKKDRDRERERERERDRERDRERERERDRFSRTSKRRRGDRLISNREDGADESSEESVNDDEDDDDEDGGGITGGGSVRMIPPNNMAGSLSIHHQQQQHQHRKSFPLPVKVIRTIPPSGPVLTTSTTTSSTWKAADEMIGVSVPRKARSASTKRSHEWASSGGAVGLVGGEQIHRQASTSPVRTGVAGMITSLSPAPASPSSSNATMRKKMANGPKQRPPKSSSKSSSSAQEEIEMEIAEVLYGLMRQPQVPSKQDTNGNDSVKFDSREVNKHNLDSKSRVSSPISYSPSTLPQPSSNLPSNSNSSATPMSAIAPKRKRPRPVKYEDETTAVAPPIFSVSNNSISSTTTKVEIDQPAKIEATSPSFENNSGSMAENDGTYLMNSSQAGPASAELVQAEPKKEEKNNLVPDSKPLTEESESRDAGIFKKEESQSPMKETLPSPANNPSIAGPRLDDERATVTKANSTVCEIESQREEKFQIDLMALPPSRSSPERDDEIDFGVSDPKPLPTDMELEMKSTVKEDDKRVKIGNEDVNVEAEDNKKPKLTAEETESHNAVIKSERNAHLKLDLEKSDRDSGIGSVGASKFKHNVLKQEQQQPDKEKSAQSCALPLPMSLASWPGGVPPMGYMAPLQGVVSMDGSAVSSASIQPPHLLFTQPRPKRCATHCYIARNVHCYQQFMKMNPFWPTAPGSASLYGLKANLNVVPASELNGNIPGRAVSSVQDKGQTLAIFPGHGGKDKSSQAATNMVDAAQRKQMLLQQALPPGAPSNILHGPAFIFPLSQQQAAAATVRPGSVKSPGAGSTTLSSSNSASVSATPAGATAAPAMSFNYVNMPSNETQYLAILQNNAYPFPFPAHVGAPPAYRGNHAQPMPFIPGSFYSSQMVHPTQLQQQQQPPTQLQQSQQGHQNTSISIGASSSQKHLQNLQQRPHGSGAGSGSGNLQGFPASKNQSPHPLPLQQRQQQPSQHASYQARHLEGELSGKDSPSTSDSRVSRANMNIYGQNFAMPLQPPNFTLMTAASLGGSTSSGCNHGEQKQHIQQPGSKAGVESLTSQSFAMSFASINGTTTPGLDISSFGRDHAILQSLPESTRQGYQQIPAAAVAAQTAQQKKNNYHASEEGNHGTNDASSVEEGRNTMAGKSSATAGQSIAFSRLDLSDSSVSTIPGSNVIDSSARTTNPGSAPRTSGSVMPASISCVNAPSGQQQLQRNQQQQQQQQQQMLQLQKPHQFGAASASRSKVPVASNGNAYSDHLPSSSMATKFPNALSPFPQNLVQTSSSPAQSPQWKNSVRTTGSQVSSPSLSSTSSSLKNISQQQARLQQNHTEISFTANPNSTQNQQPPSSTPSPSTPMVVGSPTTSISRSAGGSPRTTGSTSTGNKGCQASSLSSQQTKNSPSVPSQISSPVGGRSVPSVLGNPHLSSSSSMGTKPQSVLHQQQQQKHALHSAQLFFSNAYIHAQAQHSPTTTAASGFFLQRHRNEQQQALPPGSSTSTSVLSLCSPVTPANTGTTDPAKAVVAAAGNMKGGGIASQGLIHAAQFATTQSSGKPYQLVPGFPYVHAVPAAVQVKPAEQKQPAGE